MILRSAAIALATLLGLVIPAGSLGAGDGLAPEGDRPRSNGGLVGIDEQIGAQLPLDLPLRDESGRPITLRECIAGKPTILIPMYYRCPMICNLVLQQLVDTLREFPQDNTAGGKFNVVAVSFDPKEANELDLAADKKKVVMKEYGREGAENGWHFLTGAKQPIAELMSAIGYRYEFDKSFKEYNHPTGIIIVTPEGKISRYFMGIYYSGEYRIPGGKTTLRLSLLDAADGKGGSLLDNLTRFCYRFDHMKGGYSFNVLLAVKVGGILTLLAIGTFVFVAMRRERKYRQPVPQLQEDRREPVAGGTAASLHHNDGLPSGESA